MFSQGVKNHFLLLSSKDQTKFDKLYTQAEATPAQSQHLKVANKSSAKKYSNISDDEDEEETTTDQNLCLDAEDMHDSYKIVLQRQFFEAIVRAT